jgi:hypothetical protein
LQDRKRPGKDRTEPVHVGSVRSFAVFPNWKTGLGLGPTVLGSKDRTGPDFQTLRSCIYIFANFFTAFLPWFKVRELVDAIYLKYKILLLSGAVRPVVVSTTADDEFCSMHNKKF